MRLYRSVGSINVYGLSFIVRGKKNHILVPNPKSNIVLSIKINLI